MNRVLESGAARRLSLWALLSLTMLALLSGCNSTSSAPDLGPAGSSTTSALATKSGNLEVVPTLPLPADAERSQSDKISVNDLLEIKVFQLPDLDRTLRVGADGKLSMPLIGTMTAAGQTVPQLERQMEQRYNKSYLQSADITIFVKESLGQRVTMDGEFRKPGIYPITSQTTLLQAVAQAGGLNDLADHTKVFLYRKYGDKRKVANYSIQDIRGGKKPNPRLVGGDVVVSFTSSSKVAAQNLRQALGIATSAARLASPI